MALHQKKSLPLFNPIQHLKMNTIQKTVLITGAAAGIGNALAQKLLAENYTVIGTSRSGKIENINSPNLIVIPVELTIPDSVAKAGQLIRSYGKPIDILINNAGIGPDLDTTLPDLDLMKATFETNVFGLVHFTETVLDCLGKDATIVNISSNMGKMSAISKPGSSAYRMSKAAVNMYTKTLSARLEGKAVVYSIHPGWVQTKLATAGAPLTVAFSADMIFKLLERKLPTGTFWDAETGNETAW